MQNNKSEIIFAGGSHYGLGGYRSVCKFFDKVYLIQENPKEILDKKRNQDELISDFFSVSCPVVFLCGYARLITKEELQKKTFINVHGALLPHYRGMHATFYAIMNGEKEMGITFHLVNEWMDAGDIIGQYRFPYTGQGIAEINQTIDDFVEQYAGQTISEYLFGNVLPQKQDESQALYGARRNLEDCFIDFHMSCQMMERFFRALNPPYPYPRIMVKGTAYEIPGKQEIIPRDYYGPLGRAVNINDHGVWIKIADGYLVVDNVRNAETGEEVKLGNLIKTGYRFENNV